MSDPFAKDLVVVEGDALVELLAATEAAIAARSSSNKAKRLRSIVFQPIDAREQDEIRLVRLRGFGRALETDELSARRGGRAVQRTGGATATWSEPEQKPLMRRSTRAMPLPADEEIAAEIGTDIRDPKDVATR